MDSIRPPEQGLGLLDGVKAWRIWYLLGMQDIKMRYRGSALGPLWMVANLVVVLGGITVLYGELLNQPYDTFMPFLTVGMVIMGLFMPLLIESCNSFAGSPEIVRQVRMPLSVLVMRTLFRNLLVTAHNMVILVIIFAVFKKLGDIKYLQALAGILILILNLTWMSILLAVAGARYKDVIQIVGSALNFLVIFTPLYWIPDLIKNNRILLDANPLYHLIEVVRDPFLGKDATMTNYVVTLVLVVVGWGVTAFVFNGARKRIAFWV
jgi:ABC-type polysaccharide/polyol phosphate export permease